MNTLIIFAAKYLIIVSALGIVAGYFITPKESRAKYLIGAIVTAVIALVLTKLAGLLLYDARPFTYGIASLIPHAADNGFPSDHTVFAVTAALITLPASRRLAGSLLIIALLIGIGRVLAGVHSPIDILGGFIVASLAYDIAQLLLTSKSSLENKPR